MTIYYYKSNLNLRVMFTNLIHGYFIQNADYRKGFAPCTSNEAKRHLGRAHLKRVSVGHYDADGNWYEERIDYAWVSDKAKGFWLPALKPDQRPAPYHYAKRVLGNDCYLDTELGQLVWVSKADAGLKIPAKIENKGNKELKLNVTTNDDGDVLYDYSSAKKLIGMCHLEKQECDKIYWVSDTVERVKLRAWTPTLVLDEDIKFFGA